MDKKSSSKTISIVLVSILVGFCLGFSTSLIDCSSKEVVLDLEGTVQETFEDPWEMEFPEAETIEGSIHSLPIDHQFETIGYLDGYVTFGLTAEAGSVAIKVDGDGTVLWAYRFSTKGLLTDVRLLSNGNFLIQFSKNGVYEISPEGVVVWSHLDPTNSHHVQRLDNGNTIICETERSYAYEITREGQIVWSWDARNEIVPYNKKTYIGYDDIKGSDPISSSYAEYRELMHGRRDWTHINTAYRTKENTTILCLRNLDLLLEVDQNNNVVWSFGPLVLKHPHCPTRLDNGNTLVFDNGNGRVIEVTPDHEIVWEFGDLYSPIMGGCQRLPNGNTLITESNRGRVLVVNPKGVIVWTLVVPKDGFLWGLPEAKAQGIYRCWWYPD